MRLTFAVIRREKSISVVGAVAAFVAAATAVYITWVASQPGVSHLGRVVFFVPGFVAICVIACGAGAIMHGSIRGSALLALAAAGLGALGSVWLWINLLIPQPALMLLLSAGLATAALVAATVKSSNRRAASLSTAMGVCAAILMLVAGLGISIAPVCGSSGNSFHIDKWSRPAATVYVCGDGRLSFEFFQ